MTIPEFVGKMTIMLLHRKLPPIDLAIQTNASIEHKPMNHEHNQESTALSTPGWFKSTCINYDSDDSSSSDSFVQTIDDTLGPLNSDITDTF
jgi:hypothetical protein